MGRQNIRRSAASPLVYTVDDLTVPEHAPVALGTAKEIFFLGGVRVVGRDVVHVRAVAANLTRDGADVPAEQARNFAAAQAIDVIFSYTTALFYVRRW